MCIALVAGALVFYFSFIENLNSAEEKLRVAESLNQKELILVSFNLQMAYYMGNKKPGFIKDYLAQAGVALLQRVKVEDVKDIVESYPGFYWHFVLSNRADDPNADLTRVYRALPELPANKNLIGQLNLSRYPIKEIEVHVLPHLGVSHQGHSGQGFVALLMIVEIDGKKVSVVNALPSYPEPPISERHFIDQTNSIFAFADSKAVIIGGDFHHSPENKIWQKIDFKNWQDVWPQWGKGKANTWNPGTDRIDRIYVNKKFNLSVNQCWVFQNPHRNSTHNPIFCKFKF